MVRAVPRSRAMRSAHRALPVCTVEVTAPSVAAVTPAQRQRLGERQPGAASAGRLAGERHDGRDGRVAGPRGGIREVVGAGAGVPDPADRAAVPDVDAEGGAGREQVDEVVAAQLVGRGTTHLHAVVRLAADPHDALGEPVEARVPLTEHDEGPRAGRMPGGRHPRCAVAARACTATAVRAKRARSSADVAGSQAAGTTATVRCGEHRAGQHRAGRALPRADDEHGRRPGGEVGERTAASPPATVLQGSSRRPGPCRQWSRSGARASADAGSATTVTARRSMPRSCVTTWLGHAARTRST